MEVRPKKHEHVVPTMSSFEQGPTISSHRHLGITPSPLRKSRERSREEHRESLHRASYQQSFQERNQEEYLTSPESDNDQKTPLSYKEYKNYQDKLENLKQMGLNSREVKTITL